MISIRKNSANEYSNEGVAGVANDDDAIAYFRHEVKHTASQHEALKAIRETVNLVDQTFEATAAQYRRLVKRLGDRRALIAVAHSIVVIIYHILSRQEPYNELGADYFERRKPEAVVTRLTRQIEKLGYSVTVVPPAEAA